MPMQPHRAITAHLSRNRALWAGLFALATALFIFGRWEAGTGWHLGDLASLSGAICGALLMLMSEKGFAPTPAGEAA
ncbi:hypothetical protein JMJ55_17485 [Belnapia sp. T6]|uniref:Uncharacterized protein n=1 Tax=Belnapia mucosa TaxID=2804532 RepID=A0ABS1V706_9PROT|nr:hypothetical protein [Belnapia mucosa]MBL6457132.1 hypothetical protein [Belnapia mucosa]